MPVFDITGPDGTTYEVEGPDAQGALAALRKHLGQSGRQEPADQEMVGFGERGDREAMEEETPELRREVNVAKRMARQRPDYGAGDEFLHGATFGFEDEAQAAGAGVAGLIKGEGFSGPYSEDMEARRRIREEYIEKNPKTALAAGAAGMLAGGLPGRTAAGLGLGGVAKEGAKQGAIVGGLSGVGEGEGVEGRVIGGATGAALGATVGAAAPVVATGARAIAQKGTNLVRSAINPELEAARRVAAAKTADNAAGSGLDDAAFNRAKAAGQPVTNMERGGDRVTALARSAANQSPEARTAMEGVIAPRFASQTQRLDDVLSRESRLGMSTEDFIATSEKAARAANRPAYDKAMQLGAGDIWDSTLEQLTNAPAFQRALKTAIGKAADDAVVEGYGAMQPRIGLDAAGNIEFRNAAGMPAFPDLRLWDLTKRELRRMGDMAARNSDSDARIFRALEKKLVDHLDGLGEMGKAYRAARQTAASAFKAENAFEAGQSFATGKASSMSPNEAFKALQKMSPEERRLFREGYIAAERERLSKLPFNNDVARTTLSSPDKMARARVALGGGGARRLEAQLAVEKAMDASRKAMGNSTTVRQYVELGLASAGGSGLAGATGNTDPTSLSVGALAGAATKFGQRALSHRLSTEIGKLLASNDPAKIDTLIRLASQNPKYLDAVRSFGRRATLAGGREASDAVTDALVQD